MAAATILTKKNWKIATLSGRHHPALSILPNKTVEAGNKAIAFIFILWQATDWHKFDRLRLCVEYADKFVIFAVL